MKSGNVEWLFAGGGLTAAVGAVFKWITGLGTASAANKKVTAETFHTEIKALQEIIHELRIDQELLRKRCTEEQAVLQKEIDRLKIIIAAHSIREETLLRETIEGQP